jgi:hypothetical protein
VDGQRPGWRAGRPAGRLPQFQIWPEATLDRLRYVSVSKHLDLHPHTVVTDSLAELRTVLQSAQPPASNPTDR